ncbi:hypothetical protein [Thermococcus sp.]
MIPRDCISKDKMGLYLFGASSILGMILASFWTDLGVGVILGGWFLSGVVYSYSQLGTAECAVTKVAREDVINDAMKLAKDARNDSLIAWTIGGFFFMWFAYIGLGISMTLMGIANLVNFVIMIIAHKRYSELRKMLMILQLRKSDKAEISIKL